MIALYHPSDWQALWPLLHETFQQELSYPYPAETTETEAHTLWIDTPQETYVAKDETGELLGTYYIKPNQAGLGSHICNCGYIVSPHARGKGLASRMCLHSQERGRALGFHAMQFNLVVSTNTVAVQLWTKLGFKTIGVLPDAFYRKQEKYVDALIMHKYLNGVSS